MRVISISLGWMPGDTGYAEIMAAVEEAKSMGVLVLSSNVEQIYGYPLQGLGRVPLADPDRFESYEPGLFWARQFPAWGENSLFIPMDSRTFAGYTGRDQYAFFRSGGWSWIVPYLAGVYALAAQIDPSITPGRFFAAAMQTGRMISYSKAGLTAPLGPILDPVALVQTIGRR